MQEKPEGEEGIRTLGHRGYVGGLWEEIGQLQFDFLLAQGLKPHHCLLDIACGSLRAGVHFIRYLDQGNYLGIDKEPGLIKLGIEQELGRETSELKRPEFVVSASFEFSFSKRPQYAIAQSLFTHLTPGDITLCLGNLRQFVGSGHVFFATFFEGDSSRNPARSHSHAHFEYSRNDMESFGLATGWNPVYIGDWNHPRGQKMFKYEAA